MKESERFSREGRLAVALNFHHIKFIPETPLEMIPDIHPSARLALKRVYPCHSIVTLGRRPTR